MLEPTSCLPRVTHCECVVMTESVMSYIITYIICLLQVQLSDVSGNSTIHFLAIATYLMVFLSILVCVQGFFMKILTVFHPKILTSNINLIVATRLLQ
jgi:hypothetical protein